MTEQIYKVVGVHAARNKSEPPQLSVQANGEARSSGWTNGQLSAHVYIVPPEDGMQGFDFVADKPNGGSLMVITPILAAPYTGPCPDWVKGVRVSAGTSSVEALI